MLQIHVTPKGQVRDPKILQSLHFCNRAR